MLEPESVEAAANVNGDDANTNRMRMTRDELEWALEIKDMVEHIPELDNCCDFIYAQCAVVDRGDLEMSISRILRLQEFRQEYNIVDDYESARRAMHQFLDLFPGWMLNFSFNPRESTYPTSTAIDLCAFDMAAVKTNPRAESIIAHGCYHRGNMLIPDLETAREGFTVFVECEGHTPGKGVDLKWFRMIWDIVKAYPVKYKSVKFFHCGLFANLLLASAKKFLPPDIRSVLEIGKTAPQRLDTIFLVPSYEVARLRNLQHIDDCLQRRYHNIATFKLTHSNNHDNPPEPEED